MTKTASKIRFKAKLSRPAESEKDGSWSFLILPKNASAKLPSRGITPIEGTLNGFPFQAAIEPDGQKSHWLKVDRKLSKSAGAGADDTVALEIAPAGKDTEPEVPADLRKALAAAVPKARALWSDITSNARRDWIHWITSAKQTETRARRIKNACSMLAAGKRRVCCFDRSGFYSKSMSAPKAATSVNSGLLTQKPRTTIAKVNSTDLHMIRSTYREHEAKFDAACSWLRQLGIRIDGTRAAEYSRLLHEITEFHEAGDMDALFAKRDRANLYNALIESSEFVYIHEGLQNHADPSLSQSLRRFVSGTALLTSETADNNRPRNIGFELTVGSAAMRAKLPVAFNPPADLEINFGSTSVPIECKRPFTSRKVERNVSDGLDQLRQRYDASTNAGRARGILAVSITRTENDGSKRLEGETPADLVDQMYGICRAFITRHERHWLERVDGRTLAILLELSAPSTVRQNSIFSTTRQYVWVPLCERGSKDRQALEIVARPFETLNTENRTPNR